MSKYAPGYTGAMTTAGKPKKLGAVSPKPKPMGMAKGGTAKKAMAMGGMAKRPKPVQPVNGAVNLSTMVPGTTYTAGVASLPKKPRTPKPKPPITTSANRPLLGPLAAPGQVAPMVPQSAREAAYRNEGSFGMAKGGMTKKAMAKGGAAKKGMAKGGMAKGCK